VHRQLCFLFKWSVLQPTHFQEFTAHKHYFYRCFLPDLTGLKTRLLRKAENINATYKTFQFQQNPSTGIQSCISGFQDTGNR